MLIRSCSQTKPTSRIWCCGSLFYYVKWSLDRTASFNDTCRLGMWLLLLFLLRLHRGGARRGPQMACAHQYYIYLECNFKDKLCRSLHGLTYIHTRVTCTTCAILQTQIIIIFILMRFGLSSARKQIFFFYIAQKENFGKTPSRLKKKAFLNCVNREPGFFGLFLLFAVIFRVQRLFVQLHLLKQWQIPGRRYQNCASLNLSIWTFCMFSDTCTSTQQNKNNFLFFINYSSLIFKSKNSNSSWRCSIVVIVVVGFWLANVAPALHVISPPLGLVWYCLTTCVCTCMWMRLV